MTTPTINEQTFKDTKKCPVCGSDMHRNRTDNPHNVYVGQYTCRNHECAIEVEFRN